MKNFIQPGMYGLTVIAPAGGVVSGQLVIVGAIVGVAACDAAAGTQVEIAPEGVFDLNKTPADALAAGAVAMATAITGVVSVAGTVAIGWVVQAAAAGSATARVKLTPSVAGSAAIVETEHHHHEKAHTHQNERELAGSGRRTRE